MQRIYLDANATTPLDPRVREIMEPYLDCGNASSLHAEGRAARDAMEHAREQVAALIGAAPREIIFTSGGTEANALALLGTVRARETGPVLYSTVEHPSVKGTVEDLAPGVELRPIPVGPTGHVDPETEIPEGARLVTCMLANNETGAILPVAALARSARAAGAVMHSDAVQACGKVPVDVRALDIDLLSVSAHKMHGPKGAAALYVRRGVRLEPLARGGEHERGLRAGTENVAAIVGFGAAAELAASELDARRTLWSRLSGLLVEKLCETIPDVSVHTHEPCVPSTVNLRFPGAEGEAVLLGLDLEGIAVSTGSACSSGAAEASHVLLAMGLTQEQAEESIRISFHAGSTENDVAALVKSLARIVKSLRALQV
ncbi:MAG: cysteine desulfurase family protein [Planctomycetota bacterium]|nr:cysteine desulfurase family protein [Planctomycetota bacterium]